ncbi:uncharacterized protein isoform X2 [Rhodnius prolixus]|uniref:uncharacterized protein isoform X2 n=1 Tax=Rhodnius prolixus TaxID=13249 RepID=UPI003D188EFD
MKMYHQTLCLALACLAWTNLAGGQILFPQLSVAIQPPPLQQQQPIPYHDPTRPLAHREVVLNSEAEAQLPPHLLNPFYKNPRIAEALAKESWFGPGEVHVAQRETEKIPRSRIISVLKNAGLARRKR